MDDFEGHQHLVSGTVMEMARVLVEIGGYVVALEISQANRIEVVVTIDAAIAVTFRQSAGHQPLKQVEAVPVFGRFRKE